MILSLNDVSHFEDSGESQSESVIYIPVFNQIDESEAGDCNRLNARVRHPYFKDQSRVHYESPACFLN